MSDSQEEPGSKTAMLSGLMIAVSGVVIFAAILVPPYLSKRSNAQRTQALIARAEPLLDALIKAEADYKIREGKFWRDQSPTLAAASTKQALNIDVTTDPTFQFVIDAPDLEADPTLRISAKGMGDADGFAINCVYDSIQHSKNCKRPPAPS